MRSLAPYLRLKAPQVRGMLLIAAACCLVDWSVKKFHWWGSIPHAADRPTWLLLVFLCSCLFLLAIIPTRWMMLGCGLLLGGSLGNLIDLEVDGVVWDMIPLPDGIYANLADTWILLAMIILSVGLIGHGIRLWQSGYFVAAKPYSDLD